jgi:DNA-binding transcriptional LysR family regulator
LRLARTKISIYAPYAKERFESARHHSIVHPERIVGNPEVIPRNVGEERALPPQSDSVRTFVTVSDTAPVLRGVLDNYLKRSGIKITPAHEADHVTMGMSLIASTRGVGLLPAYAENLLPSSITSRPLKGGAPTVELVLGYKKSNQSPVLKAFAFEIGRVGHSRVK